ncbi:hypothetical protein [Rasiella sp. SM2506]|uniref:hypothetical protein n=1 Tax=Rasiella sp. SM2506 TaxID=3423914 RepID=UPI003D7B5E9A
MKKILLSIPILLLFFSCGRFSNEDKKEENEERIVCISKQYSEIIYALNAEENIKTDYPKAISKTRLMVL